MAYNFIQTFDGYKYGSDHGLILKKTEKSSGLFLTSENQNKKTESLSLSKRYSNFY